MGKLIDLTGQKFGQWTVLQKAESKNKITYWLCQCDCGTIKPVGSYLLRSGESKSCHGGKETQFHNIHGKRKNRDSLYYSWSCMKARCNNPNAKDYKYYGERGITYDQKWETFEGFCEDMASTHQDKLTLDRIDCDGNYTKDNCRWVPRSEQPKNRRNVKKKEV